MPSCRLTSTSHQHHHLRPPASILHAKCLLMNRIESDGEPLEYTVSIQRVPSATKRRLLPVLLPVRSDTGSYGLRYEFTDTQDRSTTSLRAPAASTIYPRCRGKAIDMGLPQRHRRRVIEGPVRRPWSADGSLTFTKSLS